MNRPKAYPGASIIDRGHVLVADLPYLDEKGGLEKWRNSVRIARSMVRV